MIVFDITCSEIDILLFAYVDSNSNLLISDDKLNFASLKGINAYYFDLPADLVNDDIAGAEQRYIFYNVEQRIMSPSESKLKPLFSKKG